MHVCYGFPLLQVVRKSYIDFEIELEEYENTRKLYDRLLERTQHVKVCFPLSDSHMERRMPSNVDVCVYQVCVVGVCDIDVCNIDIMSCLNA